MKREPLENLQIIEYLKRTKEDTTVEEHRMALDAAVRVFEVGVGNRALINYEPEYNECLKANKILKIKLNMAELKLVKIQKIFDTD